MAKKACHSELVSETNKGGESLPLARTSSLATPSSGGHPRNAPVDTLIEAPYELPEGWKWTRLGDVADWGSGGTPSRKNPEYYNGSIPWIKTGELNESYIFDSEEKISEEAINHSSAKLFPKETVVLAMYGATIGKTAIFGIDASTNQACACAICHKDLDNHYLFNFLKSKKDYFIYNAKGGAQPNISQEIIKDTIIPLPPTLAEQQRIVNRIETMFAKLDQAQEKAQAVLDNFETRKAAILHKAFTGELTANWRKENGVADESWEEKYLKDICSKITDGTHNSPVNTEIGEFMYITAKNIKESGIDLTNITFVTKEIHKEIYSRCNVEKGDVLYIKDGATTGIATVNTLDEEFSMLSSVADIKPIKGLLDSKYLAYVMNSSEVKAKMLNEMSGNAITRLTLVKIKNAEIPICSLLEQQEIVRILDTVLEKESRAKEAAQTVLDQIALLKKSILARAFRGKI